MKRLKRYLAVKFEARKDGILTEKQRKDRLSSLPDDILIGILSFLPLNLAVATGSLSWRWHGLWRNSTSLHITQGTFSNFREFFVTYNQIIMQITSPVIHSLTVDCGNLLYDSSWGITMHSWLRKICDLNVHELKLTWPSQFVWQTPKLPGFIFQTQSLVSVEMGSTYEFQLPDDPIILPNLKTLNLDIRYTGESECQRLKELIQACPSLENLWLQCMYGFKCSNQNIRRLFIILCSVHNDKVVINTPKLEYLAIRAAYPNDFSFEEEPILLREAKIELPCRRIRGVTTPEESELVRKLYRAIRSVSILTLNVIEVDNTSMVFPYAKQLTLDLKTSDHISTVLSFLEMCPVLDNLVFRNTDERWISPKHGNVNTIRQVLKELKNEPIAT